MKIKSLSVLLVAVFVVGVVGCGQAQKPQSANSAQAIQQTQSMPDVQAKVNFLVKEANAFLSSQKFDDAVNTAKYILSNLDKNSTEAKSILEKAQAELKKLAEQKVNEVKGDLQKTIGGLGK